MKNKITVAKVGKRLVEQAKPAKQAKPKQSEQTKYTETETEIDVCSEQPIVKNSNERRWQSTKKTEEESFQLENQNESDTIFRNNC